MRRKIYFTFLMLSSIITANSQGLTVPPNGGNKKASVSERIGITDVTIHYDRPGVKGREGKIWGTLIKPGFNDLGYGTSKAAPWRGGANENTTITFSTDVMIEGKPLQKGTYGFFVAMGNGDATLIFSKNSTSWGSFFYDQNEDALRVNVKTFPLNESVEWLKYEFQNETDTSAVIGLMWEKLEIPFKVEVDYVKTQLESFKRELRSSKGFTADAWVQAAQFALHYDDLEDALQWSDYSINGRYVGEKNFKTLSTRAMILQKQGKSAESAAQIKDALQLANMQDLHQYGRQLITEKKNKEAMEIFKLNAKKYPGVFITDVGLIRGYSANEDYENALKYAKIAKLLAPDSLAKEGIDEMIQRLNEGKDIN
ncbi:MAG TPA: DUF2911 domain-containing protein [Hanamia sp.]|nr:DUF2911 domain-containing protein [Hanamia sp.]